MAHPIPDPNITGPLDPALVEGFDLGVDAIRMLGTHTGHPAADLALHVLDLHIAAARVVALSTGEGVDMEDWSRTMSHVCEAHAHAAIYLLTCIHPNGSEGSLALIRQGHSAVTQLLAD